MRNIKIEEVRKQRRVPFKWNILINGLIMVKSIDLSEGGLYVHTGRSFFPGSIVDVEFPIRDKKLTVKAQVRHNQESVGMGLMFVGLSDVQNEIIIKFIDEEMEAKKAQIRTGKTKVLLIDDSDMTRRINKSKMTLEGFLVLEANDGVEALKILKDEIPDIIVLDLYMEKMDGFRLLSIIKEYPEWKDIPVIVFSTKGTPDVLDKVIDAGADEFLLKALTTPAKLAKTVKIVSKRHKRKTFLKSQS